MNAIVDHKTYYRENFVALHYTDKTITECEFENCTFRDCVFISCVFSQCNFVDCSFIGCSISAAKPLNSSFVSTRFFDSKIMGMNWTKARKVEALSFERCDIRYSNFSFLHLHNLILIDCVAHEVAFNEADLTGGIFTRTDFLKSVFSHTNLTKSDFRNASHYGIDFNFNTIKKAKFSLPEAASLLKSLDIVLEE